MSRLIILLLMALTGCTQILRHEPQTACLAVSQPVPQVETQAKQTLVRMGCNLSPFGFEGHCKGGATIVQLTITAQAEGTQLCATGRNVMVPQMGTSVHEDFLQRFQEKG